ncbi:cobalamin biosynthesis protein CobQ [Comamonas kerstersii]|uniref:Cobyric acid synthase n=1 Tax=Comamonas kerstersii TaxID=225992 RepID=A0A0W7Z1C5_9BURK|nr:cobyric acid synthase [Comamonas kerstersii]KUF41189.1 cobalamin biosynthesis protein CobQ [Comamonas kerstersii]
MTTLPLPQPGQRQALCVMVLGTSSNAGKSWVSTALCAWYRAQGYKVAPFKAQNMSNNARVVATPDGQWGEIGTAQYLQALACGVEPDVRMNPLLLKPEADTRSQVVLMGQVNAQLSALPWRARSAQVWPHITAALDSLRAEYEVVVIEGAGSPAEINLHDSDIVNMRVARHCDAHCLLVADIDRGGAFAHLYGTWALLPPQEQALIRGFVLNKFRGDPGLLAPAPQMLQERTGVPTVATIPMQCGHGLPEEDGVFDARSTGQGSIHTTVAIVAYPRMSNHDEFQPLRSVPGVRVVWARSPADLVGADWVILPGSKATAADLAWMRHQGLDAAVVAHAHAGRRVLGICGGLQMLGEALIDLHGVDGNAAGLGLLPLVTLFAPEKTVRRVKVQLPPLRGVWSALNGLQLQVYEIHHGQTQLRADMEAGQAQRADEPVPGMVWQSAQGNVWGTYWHGMLENAAMLQALWGAQAPSLDQVFARMALGVEDWFAYKR